ncbi:pre-mRNA 3-end-processing factor fip1l1 [Clydaea vesicula]|uniref:Pre-mRNA 3-end-processing factor fip1l1 n=1 Tax=Clydaea vesicula TaxID=447962 RepID=A0AAD5U8P5_9FUNG|nr:pre-mRNA 3-end-processing factor fip1l1 [Clydaea vesicula]
MEEEEDIDNDLYTKDTAEDPNKIEGNFVDTQPLTATELNSQEVDENEPEKVEGNDSSGNRNSLVLNNVLINNQKPAALVKTATTQKQKEGGEKQGTVSQGVYNKPGLDLNAVGVLNGKEIFEVDLEGIEDKPWREAGVDPTDYFNYGFNEITWKMYSQRQKQMRGHGGLRNPADWNTGMDHMGIMGPALMQMNPQIQQQQLQHQLQQQQQQQMMQQQMMMGQVGFRPGGFANAYQQPMLANPMMGGNVMGGNSMANNNINQQRNINAQVLGKRPRESTEGDGGVIDLSAKGSKGTKSSKESTVDQGMVKMKSILII